MRTISCAKATDLIVRDLDEGLSSPDKQILETHVQRCPHCREWREQTAGMLAAIAADVPQDPGEEFWKYYDTSLQARLREAEAGTSWGSFWKAIAAVAVAGIIFAVVWLARFEPGSQQVDVAKVSWSPVLIQELEQFYGPDAYEILPSTLSRDQFFAFTGAAVANGDEEVFGWFEVEDDPNQLL
jgi:predicted anti-sigma-YlaC factor YlaD